MSSFHEPATAICVVSVSPGCESAGCLFEEGLTRDRTITFARRVCLGKGAGRSFWLLADLAFSAGPGACVHLPKGVVHTHQAGGGKSARAIVMQAPAGVERFIAEMHCRTSQPDTGFVQCADSPI